MGGARDAEFQAFLLWAAPRLQIRVRGYRNVGGTVKKRVIRRIAELGLRSFADYREMLEASASEWQVLEAMCRIPISRFYRDRAVYEAIAATILPERAEVAAGEGRNLRVWSAGFASGEEPYSLAMIWHFDLAPGFEGVSLSITATDAEPAMLARAQSATYEWGSLAELPERLRVAGFDRSDRAPSVSVTDGVVPSEVFSVREDVRRYVAFELADLRSSMPEGPFDVVLCRNSLFTYVDEGLQPELADRLIDRLAPGGYLVVGSHETPPPLPRLSRPFSGISCIYRRPAA